MTTLFHWYIIYTVFSFILGTCIGSFLNVCIYRIPRELSTVLPRSHCPHCEKTIPWFRNIPILSYLLLRGRCAECGGGISPRYVLVEALTGVLFLLAALKIPLPDTRPLLGLSPAADLALVPVYWLVVSGLVMGTFVDFEHLIIPDRVTLGGIVAGLFLSVAVPSLHHAGGSIVLSVMRSAIGLVLGWGILWGIAHVGKLIFRKDAMGFGDVKLLGAIGAFFGWRGVLFTLILSSFAGSVAGVALVIAGQKQMQSRIPYGPFLALAALLWMLWGPTWWLLYLDLMTPDLPPL